VNYSEGYRLGEQIMDAAMIETGAADTAFKQADEQVSAGM
jgi:hypothetical protein